MLMSVGPSRSHDMVKLSLRQKVKCSCKKNTFSSLLVTAYHNINIVSHILIWCKPTCAAVLSFLCTWLVRYRCMPHRLESFHTTLTTIYLFTFPRSSPAVVKTESPVKKIQNISCVLGDLIKHLADEDSQQCRPPALWLDQSCNFITQLCTTTSGLRSSQECTISSCFIIIMFILLLNH